ncbi:hypothetical protein GUITHDRAFT_108849 [Guillardia theta CCMP2712]|uniref:Uncharacterized protein n=1 Tax=Guillardia theta (strain CCMP2712) TaxID=905079 RepID=L1JA59_GUITC|nr:hypothetical protein GUITHDRAFT_108849 [Guillardia theta CCMP2712]EKX45207.1 hypothetical protein GUITHDRAFT_108849 [Guillardia theta CCMP2712]|eukprot:XP_005832187.1 hypothetical protein GUITHDRAFT_108849 [Guillardia theta CCMP2712]
MNSTNLFVPGCIVFASNVTLPSYGISSRSSIGVSEAEYTDWSSPDALTCKVGYGLQGSIHFTISQDLIRFQYQSSAWLQIKPVEPQWDWSRNDIMDVVDFFMCACLSRYQCQSRIDLNYCRDYQLDKSIVQFRYDYSDGHSERKPACQISGLTADFVASISGKLSPLDLEYEAGSDSGSKYRMAVNFKYPLYASTRNNFEADIVSGRDQHSVCRDDN